MSVSTVNLIMLTAVIATIIWDVFLYVDGKEENTISAGQRKLGRSFFAYKEILCGGIGLLLGHWFWPEAQDLPLQWAIVVTGSGLILVSMATPEPAKTVCRMLATIAIGMLAGRVWW